MLNVISFVEPGNKLNFNVNESLNDLLVEDNLIQSIYTESLSKCAMICAMEENCFSFAYKEDAVECKGYNVTKWYSLPGSATASQGWRHYSAKEAGRLTNLFGKESLMRVQYPKYAYGLYCLLNPIENGVYVLIGDSYYIDNETPIII